MKKKFGILLGVVLLGMSLAGCGASTEETTQAVTTQEVAEEKVVVETTVVEEQAVETVSGEIVLAAAASLEKAFTDALIPMFHTLYPDVTVTSTYDSSGKLQTQIEEGAEVDIFFSAATKQMKALVEGGFVSDTDVVNLLENKLVLITPIDKTQGFVEFTDIVNANMVALGDPASVPAGQYAQEALTYLGLWEEVITKASLGTNVTEVLNWVAEASADAGIVYATDAAKMPDKVSVIAQAPADSLSPVIYPVSKLIEAQNPEAADAFIAFLQSDEALAVFESYGFSIVE